MRMALPTSNNGFVPNAQYDIGSSAAGCGRISLQATLEAAIPDGLLASGVLNNSTIRVGFSAAGVSRANPGPNAAGQPRNVDLLFG